MYIYVSSKFVCKDFLSMHCVGIFLLSVVAGFDVRRSADAYSVPKCLEEVVRNAERQGFFHSIYNCLRDTNRRPGPQICLARFISDNAVGSTAPIPDGECADAYQTLVNTLSIVIPPNCLQSELTSEIPFPEYACVNSMIHGFQLFHDATSVYPVRLCTAAQVRQNALESDYELNVASLFKTFDFAWRNANVACDLCYQDQVFITPFSGLVQSPTERGLVEACSSDPAGDVCTSSLAIRNAQKKFQDCAGFDIMFKGPVCTSEQVAAVDDLVPKPYHVIVHCAYNPSTRFCKYIEPYMAHIESLTSVDCVACYTELQTNVAAFTGDVCAPNVFTNECTTHLADALAAFATCSGTLMNVGSP